jgi:hypothetical protein
LFFFSLFLIEHRPAEPHVLPHHSRVHAAEHRLTGTVDRRRSDLWRGGRGDGLDHQALFLGASSV